jgi:hypothetical protein
LFGQLVTAQYSLNALLGRLKTKLRQAVNHGNKRLGLWLAPGLLGFFELTHHK